MRRGLNRNQKEILLDEPTKKFLSSLRFLRKRAGKSLKDIAEQIDSTLHSVHDWEVGRCYPQLEKLIRLAEIFNYDISESLNYKYFSRTINPQVIKQSMKRYGLDYLELEHITGFKRNRVRASVLLRDDGTISCLAAVLAVIEQERKFSEFRKEILS